MPIDILETMARQGFEELIAIHDRASGLRGFLGIHDTSAGPAFGGIRRWSYRDDSEALRDCLRLSRAMTRKLACADLAAGGGKVVLLNRRELDLEGAYHFVGRLVERLGGRFRVGPDVGTGDREMAWVGEESAYAAAPGPEGPGQLAECTARGVFDSMATVLRHLDGEVDWPARTVVIQGLGDVGSRLAILLKAAGVQVKATEINGERAEEMAERGIELLAPGQDIDANCDIFAPCAMGGILHDLTVSRLGCRAVVGSANNILARSKHGRTLAERGILFAPDMLTTAGAVIRGALFMLEDRREEPEAIGERIAANLRQVLDLSAAEGVPPEEVAILLADQRLAERRA
ncbi:MAG: leucine dehydrogenase [Planctomycetes bacterium]|nr:leucine dehydrogenase [Planctomycetota bacterium]